MLSRLSRGFAALALGAFAFSVAPQEASAQGVKFGVAASWADDYGIGAGALAKFHLTELSGKPVTGRANFDYFFDGGLDCTNCGDATVISVSLDGLYDLTPKGSLRPYVGAGIGWSRWSYNWDNGYCNLVGVDCDVSATHVGPQALFGLNLNGKMAPFVEAKYEFRSGGQLVLKGGIMF